jgi:hypothetical protein
VFKLYSVVPLEQTVLALELLWSDLFMLDHFVELLTELLVVVLEYS